ncbi:hypothetical protein [Altererythrobacter sp.]|uniref:hypothetical protein n=1 Tax=Altererythrobacter sp. TaxID=1872480 RepID=UPI003D07F44B
MSDRDGKENWYRRNIGRRIELGMNRLLGSLLGAIGLLAAYLSLSSDEFDWTTHWPGLVVATGLLLTARYCFRAEKSVIDDFGDGEGFVPPGKREE